MSREKLPEYSRPPVTEVVCGLKVEPVERMLAPHLGLLWQRFKPEFPRCQEVAPLAIRPLGSTDDSQAFEVADIPPLPRVWFIHSAGDRLIQVQRDLFMYNWRKLASAAEYPRYNVVYSDFKTHLKEYADFLAKEELGEMRPSMYELTYVNHVPFDEGWEGGLENLGEVVPCWAWNRDHHLLSQPRVVDHRLVFDLPDDAGKLFIRLRTASRREDKRQVLVLELTARGEAKQQTNMDEWFDIAHKWIVSGFTELTSSRMHTHWGRTR